MGDSDDELERRRGREKFMKERTDFGDRQRRDFVERRGFHPREFRPPPQAYQQRRPDMSPPMMRKRRPDWDEGADRSANPDQAAQGPPKPREEGSGSAAPPILMTFKQFLATQDDTISDDDAVQRYQEYKLEFKRQQLHSFFVAHKDEEWFRLKYHPEESAKRRNEQLVATRRRLEVYMDLLEKGWVDRGRLDQDNVRNIIKLLDAVVVKLEGGTDEDLAVLQQMEIDDLEDQIQELGSSANRSEKEKSEANGNEDAVAEPRKKRRRRSGSNKGSLRSDEDGAVSDSESDSGVSEKSGSKVSENASEKAVKEKDKEKEKGSSVVVKKASVGSAGEPESDKKKILLHRTSSIFLRNIAPSITRQEIEALCKKFPGYLRTALAEPMAERCFYRRGWVSYRRDVNIKDIWWSLSNVKLTYKHPIHGPRECELGAIVNRDLTRKTRAVNGITVHKQVAKADLRHAAKLVQIFDRRAGLWIDDNSAVKSEFEMDAAISSKNPLLDNITDYLVEEASAEEDELLGGGRSADDSGRKVIIERDDSILKILDRLILYLRIVHSFDYYNHGEYQNEDEMPNRCGLIHIRGPTHGANVGEPTTDPASGKATVIISASFVNEFMQSLQCKLEPFLKPKEKISDEEAEKLGRKDAEKEIEAFINANCMELAKEKWLCPLSGKKFKGPDFVRKHILSKHTEKVDEVRQEVLFFNNYVYDIKRPINVDTRQLQGASGGPDEHRPPNIYTNYNRPQFRPDGNMQEGDRPRYGGDRFHGGYQHPQQFHRGYHHPGDRGSDFRGGYRGRGQFQNRDRYSSYPNRPDNYDRGGRYQQPHRGMSGERRLVEYRDLDAPADDQF